MAKARPTNLVRHGQCKVDDERERVLQAWPQETGVVPTQTSKLEILKCIVKRRSSLPQGNLDRKTKLERKVKKTPLCTRKLDASSPEMVNTRFSNHRYMGKIFQWSQKQFGPRAGMKEAAACERDSGKCHTFCERGHSFCTHSHAQSFRACGSRCRKFFLRCTLQWFFVRILSQRFITSRAFHVSHAD